MTTTGGGPASGGNASGEAGAPSEAVGGTSAGGAGGTPISGAGGSAASGAGGNLSGGTGGSVLGGEAGEFSSGGFGASGGTSGGGGGEGGAPGDALEPVRIIRGDAEQYWDLTLRGEGLEAHEGKHVLVRIGYPDRPPERLGSGEALIDNGSFELVFPAVWEADLYKVKLALIDLDGDGACDLSVDRLFADARAVRTDVLVVSLEGGAGGNRLTESEGEVGDAYCNDWFNREWPRE